MLQLIIAHAVAAVFAPVLMRVLHRKAFLVLAMLPAASAVWAGLQTPAVLAGDYPTQDVVWVGQLGLSFSFRLDVLSWLMTLIVGGLGAVILFYCWGYFARGAQAMGRFGGVFVAFAGAMLGLVTTDNTLLAYLFWELTTVFSFLLIGHYHERQGSRRAAMQSITVTTLGGLAMLAGLVMLGVCDAGSFRISTLVVSAASGDLVAATSQLYVSGAILMVLAGAITKSAQLPFHFWLPAAMAAPTPVSGYLHAAAMVKAGVYLIARLAPGFASLTVWHWPLLIIGATTMIFGGWRSLRQFDLKLLLAYGTVSQLGFIIVLVSYQDRAVALAGLTMLLAHALFKAALFLSVGAIDHEFKTRDLRQLSGLANSVPGLMVCATVALASMAGLPPMLGYVGKEAALAALFTDSPTGKVAYIALVVGSILTMAYSLRLWWGAFATKPGLDNQPRRHVEIKLFLPVALLAALSLGFGFIPALLTRALAGHADALPGPDGHLGLWGGFGPALWGTLIVVGGGVAVFVALGRSLRHTPAPDTADRVYRSVIAALNTASANVTAFIQRGSLPSYLATMLWVMVSGVLLVLMFGDVTWPTRLRLWDSPAQAALALLAGVAAVMVVRSRRRMKAVLLVSVVGFATAMLFALQGAPDLALTQALVETVTLVVFVLVMRRLPAHFSDRPWLRSRISRIVIGVLVGAVTVVLGWFAADARVHDPVTVSYPQDVFQFGYGRNIVNVTLVDTRAWDTIGEISVLLAAATGVASLIFLRQRRRRDLRAVLEQEIVNRRVWAPDTTDRISAIARPSGPVAANRGRIWLAGSLTLATVRRSLIFEIGARLIFHPLLIFSLFLLFSGHNQPGGGFAGGVLAGIALVIRYLAGGRYELALASRNLRPGALLGAGMTIATAAALVPVAVGGTILQTTIWDFELPAFGPVHLATALFFDMGVYLIVIGLVLDILTSLGGEIDRQAEIEGEQAPDVGHDDPESLAGEDVVVTDQRSTQ